MDGLNELAACTRRYLAGDRRHMLPPPLVVATSAYGVHMVFAVGRHVLTHGVRTHHYWV